MANLVKKDAINKAKTQVFPLFLYRGINRRVSVGSFLATFPLLMFFLNIWSSVYACLLFRLPKYFPMLVI